MNLRRLAGDILFGIRSKAGVYRLRNTGGSLAVLMYHGLEEDPQKLAVRPLDVHPAHCLDEIRFFIKQGYQVISPAELTSVDGSGNYLIITFDDGHLNIARHLRGWMGRYSLPVTLAVCPDIIETQAVFWWEEVAARLALSRRQSISVSSEDGDVLIANQNEFSAVVQDCTNRQLLERVQQLREQTDDVSEEQLRDSYFVHANLNWSQIGELADNPLCTIAAHSMAHEMATSLSDRELLQNAARCRQVLQQQCGQAVDDYVYPNGRLTEHTDQIIAAAGYRRCYGLSNSINPAGTSSGNIKRIRGYGKGSENLQYYAHLWRQWHSPADSNAAVMSY